MNTSKLTSAIATLSFVFFISLTSIANSSNFSSGDLHKSGDKSMPVTSANETDLSYLRFDVNKYVNEEEAAEITNNSLDYLRFDVNNYISETEISEMPSNEFDYLRFDVNSFINETAVTEMPANEFEYLRFDVNKYTNTGNSVIDELPVTE